MTSFIEYFRLNDVSDLIINIIRHILRTTLTILFFHPAIMTLFINGSKRDDAITKKQLQAKVKPKHSTFDSPGIRRNVPPRRAVTRRAVDHIRAYIRIKYKPTRKMRAHRPRLLGVISQHPGLSAYLIRIQQIQIEFGEHQRRARGVHQHGRALGARATVRKQRVVFGACAHAAAAAGVEAELLAAELVAVCV